MKISLVTCLSTLAVPSLLFTEQCVAQVTDTVYREHIAVVARPSADSVCIRWAPLSFAVWRSGNDNGYVIERYLVSRDGQLLTRPKKLILGTALKPAPEAEWAAIVPNDKYAAIAAQALFGDRFEVDLQQSDVITVVNKVQENEQRFSFALFAADMSVTVAKASGLFFTDRTVRPGDKYLYRVVIAGNEALRGSVYVSDDDPYVLYPPANLKAEFKDVFVSLRWDKYASPIYSGYVLERSEDGIRFKRISDTPLTTVAPTAADGGEFEYATDSLPATTQTYHYRVRGLTPFGETGPPSESVHGKAEAVVEQVPYIITAESADNRSVDVRWDFPSHSNRAIRGFEIQRAQEQNGNFVSLADTLLAAHIREFKDRAPTQSNYYKVLAYGLDRQVYQSHVYFTPLIDSVPPTSPSGLVAAVSDKGVVTLQWTPSAEPDIYGYRVYKAYHRSEELAQITAEPVSQSLLKDSVNLNTLNESVYYSVMSIDRNQNHSTLSPLLEVRLPDKVKPQPPVLLPTRTDLNGVSLSWRAGASEDIVEYKIYRKTKDEERWSVVYKAPATEDSAYHFHDHSLPAGVTALYTLVSVDEAGLESDPAHAVTAIIPATLTASPVLWQRPRVIKEENKLTLVWDYNETRVNRFRIYRGVGTNPLVVLANVSGKESRYTDAIIPGTTYRYRIMAVFENGRMSALSDELQFVY